MLTETLNVIHLCKKYQKRDCLLQSNNVDRNVIDNNMFLVIGSFITKLDKQFYDEEVMLNVEPRWCNGWHSKKNLNVEVC